MLRIALLLYVLNGMIIILMLLYVERVLIYCNIKKILACCGSKKISSVVEIMTK